MDTTPKKQDDLTPLPPSQPGLDVLPDHPFTRMRRMLLDSAGKLPMPLVLIIMTALVVTVVTGVSMKMMAPTAQEKFLPLRLTPDPDKPAIDPLRIQGAWTTSVDNKVMSLRLEKDTFELIVKPPGKNFNRRFSRGSYRIEGDVLVLSPRGDLGKPGLNSEGLVFTPVALHNINLRVEENGKLMVWVLTSSERRYQDRDVLALLTLPDDKPLTWVRMANISN